MEQFVLREVQEVFGLDCLESSHPISIPVGHPDEIGQIFDRISYGKGGRVMFTAMQGQYFSICITIQTSQINLRILQSAFIRLACEEIYIYILIAGASIIRMMNHFLTEVTFRRGLRNYLDAL